MRMVSSSSWVTPSPSIMMELIRSSMCICTFWLWLLLEKKRKKKKNSNSTIRKYAQYATNFGKHFARIHDFTLCSCPYSERASMLAVFRLVKSSEIGRGVIPGSEIWQMEFSNTNASIFIHTNSPLYKRQYSTAFSHNPQCQIEYFKLIWRKKEERKRKSGKIRPQGSMSTWNKHL